MPFRDGDEYGIVLIFFAYMGAKVWAWQV